MDFGCWRLAVSDWIYFCLSNKLCLITGSFWRLTVSDWLLRLAFSE